MLARADRPDKNGGAQVPCVTLVVASKFEATARKQYSDAFARRVRAGVSAEKRTRAGQ